MRLNKTIKEDILSYLTMRVFQDKYEVALESIVELMDLCVSDYFYEGHSKALEVKDTHEQYLIEAHKCYSIDGISIEPPKFDLLKRAGVNVQGYNKKYLRSSTVRYYVSNIDYHLNSVPASKLMKTKMLAKQKNIIKIHDEYLIFIREVNAVLATCNTYKSIIEIFPEVKNLLPAKASKLPVPVSVISSIKNKLKAA